ncbi:MAG: hypothetical protein ACREA9_25655, partial [Pyrinomonadaceae bacterium]
MNALFKSLRGEVGSFILMLAACLLMAAFNPASCSARAGGVSDAQAAFDKWVAANEAVAKAKEDLKNARERRERLMAAAPKTAGSNAQVVTANGLQVVTFGTINGRVIVNLPDDMRAGDTISGTVVAEPKGNTPEEKSKSHDQLNAYVIDLGETRVSASQPRFTWTPSAPNSDAPPRYLLKIVEVYPGTTPSERTIAGTVITPNPKITSPTHPSGAIITAGGSPTTPPPFIFPPVGQTGRPLEIVGPFDGDSSNTTLSWTVVRSTVQDFEKNTENVSGGFGLLAESPRKAVFTAPTNVTGPIELHLTEGQTQTTGNFRNVGVNLSAPKTNLMKGEKTTLTVQVNGLEGLKEPVPLTLDSRGVITMEGGAFQPLTIQPSQVGADGRYTTTRGITGVRAGGWSATATVVTQPFNIVLRDPTPPQTILV